jgi:hypothetical protein
VRAAEHFRFRELRLFLEHRTDEPAFSDVLERERGHALALDDNFPADWQLETDEVPLGKETGLGDFPSVEVLG